MDSVDKLWSKVDSLEETRIRHDERMKQLEAGQSRAMEHFAKLEAKFDDVRNDIAAGFQTVSARIDEIEGSKREHKGYEAAQKETRVAMMKQFALWVSIVGLGASFLFWVLTRGA